MLNVSESNSIFLSMCFAVLNSTNVPIKVSGVPVKSFGVLSLKRYLETFLPAQLVTFLSILATSVPRSLPPSSNR